jgi:hypothetical protein
MKVVITFLIVLLFSGLASVVFQFNLSERFLKIIESSSENWRIQPNFMYDWRFGMLIFLGIAIALVLILKRQFLNFSVFYLIISVPILLSLNNTLFPFLIYLLPSRSILLITCLLWVLFSIFLNFIFFKKIKGQGIPYLSVVWRKSRKINLHYLINLLIITLFISQFIPPLSSHFSFMQARNQNADWFTNQKEFINDFEALKWIYRNVSPEDLILNDLAYSSFYLLSFSTKNVSIMYEASKITLSEELQDFSQVWRNPRNYTYLKTIIENYDVKYVFVTSELRFYDFIMSKNNVVEYTHKFYTPAEYIIIFNSYPFLTPIFRKGESVIYRISS